MNSLLRTAAVVAALASSAASANIVYSVNHAIGAGSIMGSIETDGTQGVISSANIVGWTFTANSASLSNGSPFTFGSALGGALSEAGSALSATLTDLVYDYGASGTNICSSSPALLPTTTAYSRAVVTTTQGVARLSAMAPTALLATMPRASGTARRRRLQTTRFLSPQRWRLRRWVCSVLGSCVASKPDSVTQG